MAQSGDQKVESGSGPWGALMQSMVRRYNAVMADDCLFCKMRDGEIPVTKVAEHGDAFAIRDINPRAPTHLLIIPNEHIPTAREINIENEDVLGDLFALAIDAARATGVYESGYRLAFNVGDDAGMTIHHLHLHLLGGRRLGPEG
jgi:histidine triad (HIT) family protein